MTTMMTRKKKKRILRMKKTDSQIAESMAAILDPELMAKASNDVNIREALFSLDKAATIFDNMGKFVLAEAVTQIIERIPAALKKETE